MVWIKEKKVEKIVKRGKGQLKASEARQTEKEKTNFLADQEESMKFWNKMTYSVDVSQGLFINAKGVQKEITQKVPNNKAIEKKIIKPVKPTKTTEKVYKKQGVHEGTKTYRR